MLHLRHLDSASAIDRMASQNSSDEPSGETSGHHTQESLETIVAEQYSVGSVKHTLDLRRRRLSSRDLATLQVLWPPGVQVLNLVSA